MPTTDKQSYPGLERIADQATRDNLRMLWDKQFSVDRAMRGPLVGTLDPDTKPKGLGQKDRGTRFLATDYNRIYVWDGSGWTDDPASQPARGAVHWFSPEDAPGNGWVRAQGGTSPKSTPDGRVEFTELMNISDILGLKAWVRV